MFLFALVSANKKKLASATFETNLRPIPPHDFSYALIRRRTVSQCVQQQPPSKLPYLSTRRQTQPSASETPLVTPRGPSMNRHCDNERCSLPSMSH